MSLHTVLNALNASNARIEQSKGIVSNAINLQRDAVTEQIGAQQNIGNANSIIDLQAAQAQLQAQNNTRAAATALGTNMDVNSQIVTQVAASLRSQTLRAMNQAEKLSKVAEGGLIGGIYDMLYGEEERAKLDTFNKGVETTSSALSNLNNLTLGISAAQDAMKMTHTTATMAALQERISAESQLKESQLKAQLGELDIKEVEALSSMDGRQISNLVQGEQMRAMAEQRAFMNEQRRLAKLEADNQKEYEQQLMNYVNAGIEATGANIPKVNSYKDLKLMKELGEAQFGTYLKLGFDYMQTGEAKVGATPFDALRYAENNPSMLNPTQARVVTGLQSAEAKGMTPENILRELGIVEEGATITPQILAANADAIAKASKDTRLMERLSRAALNAKIVEDKKAITPGDKNNIYSLPDYSFFADHPIMESNGFLKQVIKPIAESEGKDGANLTFNGNTLHSLGLMAIKDGMSQAEVAEGIVYLTSAGVAYNNVGNRYRFLGMPNQDSANFEISIDSKSIGKASDWMFKPGSKKQIINLLNYSEVNSALTAGLEAQRDTTTLQKIANLPFTTTGVLDRYYGFIDSFRGE